MSRIRLIAAAVHGSSRDGLRSADEGKTPLCTFFIHLFNPGAVIDLHKRDVKQRLLNFFLTQKQNLPVKLFSLVRVCVDCSIKRHISDLDSSYTVE